MCTFKPSDSQIAYHLCLDVPAIQVLPSVPFFFLWEMNDVFPNATKKVWCEASVYFIVLICLPTFPKIKYGFIISTYIYGLVCSFQEQNKVF